MSKDGWLYSAIARSLLPRHRGGLKRRISVAYPGVCPAFGVVAPFAAYGDGACYAFFSSTTNTGTIEPPPAVTLRSVWLLRRQRQPCTRSPRNRKGSESTRRRSISNAAICGHGRELLVGDLHAFLNDGRFGGGGGQGRVPCGLFGFPADEHALAAVFVVRFDHQPLAVCAGPRQEVNWIAGRVESGPFLDSAGPGDVRFDRLLLVCGEKMSIALVAGDSQAGLFVGGACS